MEPALLLAEERTRRTAGNEGDFLGRTSTSTFSAFSSLLYSENMQQYSVFWMLILKYLLFFPLIWHVQNDLFLR